MALDPQVQAELKSLLAAALADFKNDILPIVADAAKAAVSSANPVLGVVAVPIIDAVDSYVMGILGQTIPANAQVAPTDVESRVTAVEKHVAALTVATGHATSVAMPAAKAAAVAAPQAEAADGGATGA